jgi:hypothetical protein
MKKFIYDRFNYTEFKEDFKKSLKSNFGILIKNSV